MAYLKNTWYMLAWAKDIQEDTLLRREVLDTFLLCFRNKEGTVKVIEDKCPHRFAPLSMGKKTCDGRHIQCPYHGLEFDENGVCVHNPHGERIPSRAVIQRFQVIEKYLAIWVWMGDPAKADESVLPEFNFMNDVDYAVGVGELLINANYELESDNILDLSHIEFVHPLFSSENVSKGHYTCEVVGDTVWSKRVILEDTLPSFLYHAFGIPDGEKADRWLTVRWNPPASMALWTGGVPTGQSMDDELAAKGIHIFTPATQHKTHYFFANATPRSIGPRAQALADGFISAALGENGIFTAEDKPILEAQEENMRNIPFWDLNPIVMNIDAGGVQARRILEKLITQENT